MISQLELTTVEDIVTPLLGNSKYRSVFGGEGFIPVRIVFSRERGDEGK